MSNASVDSGPFVRTTTLPDGEAVPVLGMGTWGLGEDLSRRTDEIAALKVGIELGMRVIDTAEMYGDGSAEELVAAAIAGRRDELFLVSKVLPWHATKQGTIEACEGSLSRLGTDHLDLLLLHWRGQVPLRDTLAGFEALMQDGRIRRWGVSNFDLEDMEELLALPGGNAVSTDQVLYNVTRRSIEFDLLPWCQQQRIPCMAYSPIERGRLADNVVLQAIAQRHDATPAQVALAWVLRQERVIAIPRAGTPEHARQNHGALALKLSAADLHALDRAFPPPRQTRPLEMI
jgi:diketogulonate reductase-like aldo/keto reductase